MNARTTRRIAALAGSAALAAALSAGVANAQTEAGPGGTIAAAIAVPSVLTFTFTSATSFAVAPGATAPAAVAFTVSSNDGSGYSVSQAAPDLSGPGGITLPAGDLSELLHWNDASDGTGVAPNAVQLTNASASIINSHMPSLAAGDAYAEDWTAASLPANTPPGSYATTISYVAAGL